jgi:hypothetical protein
LFYPHVANVSSAQQRATLRLLKVMATSAGNAVHQDLTQSPANDLQILADAMSELIPAHSIDDFPLSIDEQCALHVGACCKDGIMDAHSPQNLQGRPAYVDLVATLR